MKCSAPSCSKDKKYFYLTTNEGIPASSIFTASPVTG